MLIAKNIDSSETTTKVLDTNRFINMRRSTRTDVNNGIQGIMLQDQMNGESIVEVDPVGQLLDA